MTGVPVCPCGMPMRLDAKSESWACPQTVDAGGWGRPTKGHVHFYADEDHRDGRPPEKT